MPRKYKYITVKQFCAKCDRIISRKYSTVNQAILGMREGSIYCMFCKEYILTGPDLFSSMRVNHENEASAKDETPPKETNAS